MGTAALAKRAQAGITPERITQTALRFAPLCILDPAAGSECFDPLAAPSKTAVKGRPAVMATPFYTQIADPKSAAKKIAQTAFGRL